MLLLNEHAVEVLMLSKISEDQCRAFFNYDY